MAIMISRALNVLGLMRVSEHEAALNAFPPAYHAAIEKMRKDRADAEAKCRRAIEERDDWKRMANDFGERFNAAEAKRNKALAWAKEQHQRADKYAAEIEALHPDALLWRNARDKRSRDRKAARKGSVS